MILYNRDKTLYEVADITSPGYDYTQTGLIGPIGKGISLNPTERKSQLLIGHSSNSTKYFYFGITESIDNQCLLGPVFEPVREKTAQNSVVNRADNY